MDEGRPRRADLIESYRRRVPWIIIAPTFLVVIAILTLGYRSFRATEEAAFTEFNRRQLVLAQGAASGIELYFESLAGALGALGKIPEVADFEAGPSRQEIGRKYEELAPLGVNDIGLLDPSGILRFSAAAPRIEGSDFSWRAYFQRARELASSAGYVVEFVDFKGVDAGQMGVLIAVPMLRADAGAIDLDPVVRFAGVTLATLELATVTERFVTPIRSSESGRAFLIDGDHTILSMADPSLFSQNRWSTQLRFPHSGGCWRQ